MERVLVTGAGGYVGTSLVPMLPPGPRGARARPLLLRPRPLAQHERLELVRADSRRLEPAVRGRRPVIDLVAISNDPSGELFPDAT